jgi:hypothetical protein
MGEFVRCYFLGGEVIGVGYSGDRFVDIFFELLIGGEDGYWF